jgi:hypothetical protein
MCVYVGDDPGVCSSSTHCTSRTRPFHLHLLLTPSSPSIQTAVCSQLLYEVTDRPAQHIDQQPRRCPRRRLLIHHRLQRRRHRGRHGQHIPPKGTLRVRDAAAIPPERRGHAGRAEKDSTGPDSTGRRRGPSSEPEVTDPQGSQSVARCTREGRQADRACGAL